MFFFWHLSHNSAEFFLFFVLSPCLFFCISFDSFGTLGSLRTNRWRSLLLLVVVATLLLATLATLLGSLVARCTSIVVGAESLGRVGDGQWPAIASSGR